MSLKKIFLRLLHDIKEPVNVRYAPVVIELLIYRSLLIFYVVALCGLLPYVYQQYAELFAGLGPYSWGDLILDILVYASLAWIGWSISDAFARLATRLVGNLIVGDKVSESKVVYYMMIAIFCLVMLMTLQYGWLYFCYIAFVSVLLVGILKRTTIQEGKVALALVLTILTQILFIPWLLLPKQVTSWNDLLLYLIFFAAVTFFAGIVQLVTGKKAAGVVTIGYAVGLVYLISVIYMYLSAGQACLIKHLFGKLNSDLLKLLMLGFTPLTDTMLSMAHSTTSAATPIIGIFVLILLLALAAIPEEMLCRSVIPVVGVYLTTFVFISLHIPTRLASIMMPFGYMIAPVLGCIFITIITYIATASLFIVSAYRVAGLVGSITLHAFYDTLIYAWFAGTWLDVAALNIALILGIFAVLAIKYGILK